MVANKYRLRTSDIEEHTEKISSLLARKWQLELADYDALIEIMTTGVYIGNLPEPNSFRVCLRAGAIQQLNEIYARYALNT